MVTNTCESYPGLLDSVRLCQRFWSQPGVPVPTVGKVIVPHSGSGVVPMSSLSGVEHLGFWEFGMGGTIG
jgi:hypothetical protein